MPSPSARPLKYPHRGEPFEHQAHIESCRLIIIPFGSKPTRTPRNALSGGFFRKFKRLSHLQQGGNTGQTCAFYCVWVLFAQALSDLIDPTDGNSALLGYFLCRKSWPDEVQHYRVWVQTSWWRHIKSTLPVFLHLLEQRCWQHLCCISVQNHDFSFFGETMKTAEKRK